MIVRVPWLPRFKGLALFGRLIVIQRGYDELIPHEQFHIKQQNEIGAFRYHWKWITDKAFRAEVEAEAYRLDGKTEQEIESILKRDYWI